MKEPPPKKIATIRIAHSSDWHVGKKLYGRGREHEYHSFFEWLPGCLAAQAADVLIIAGDIFDTTTPSHVAQEQYFDALAAVRRQCRHVVVVAGNHDSPLLLASPSALLGELGIHIVGGGFDAPKSGEANDAPDHVLVLRTPDGTPELIVCAVPFLRDSDVRKAQFGESAEDKQRELTAGISAHYRQVAERAASINRELVQAGGRAVPVVATGHLFVRGGKTGDGVRDLYIGGLGEIGTETFPLLPQVRQAAGDDVGFDYVALGHLHLPQDVGGGGRIRYSGAPLQMGFGEVGQQKSLTFIDLPPPIDAVDVSDFAVQEVPIPCFQRLAKLSGELADIVHELERLIQLDESCWVEIEVAATESPQALKQQLTDMVEGTSVEVLKLGIAQTAEQILRREEMVETLAELDHFAVFAQLVGARMSEHSPHLEKEEEERQQRLHATFRELVQLVENAP